MSSGFKEPEEKIQRARGKDSEIQEKRFKVPEEKIQKTGE